MKHSVGKSLTAGVANTVFTVPAGYKADLSLLFISNRDTNNKTVTVYWQHAHDVSHKIHIIDSYALAANTFLQFSNGNVVFQSGDSLVITPQAAAIMDVIVTFDLRKEPQTVAFDGE